MAFRLTLDPVSGQLVDDRGRTRLFRGLNVVYKAPPYHPDIDAFDARTSFCDKDVDILARLGLNVIRLHVSWAALEPVRDGDYDMKYLDVIRRIVRMCADKGIWTLLEFHQDVLCPQLNGHGAPLWLHDKAWSWGWMGFPFPLRWPFRTAAPHDTPDSAQTASLPWYLGYLSYAACEAFQRLYNNDAGLLDSFASYWQTIALYFRDEPYILGYELINEPWLGNIYKNPLLLLPGYAARNNVHRLNAIVGSAIRAVDPCTPIFVSEPTLDVGCGYTHIPFPHPGSAGGEERTRMIGPAILAYHFYRPPHRNTPAEFMEVKIREAKRLGMGTFMTEFEMWPGPPAQQATKFKSIAKTLTAADRQLQSWIGWSYKTFAQTAEDAWDGSLIDPRDGTVIPDMERLLSRPYAEAVAGEILEMRFDEHTAIFELKYRPDCESHEDTLVFVQEDVWYAKAGFTVQAYEESSNGVITCRLEDKQLSGARIVRVSCHSTAVRVTSEAVVLLVITPEEVSGVE